DTCIDGASLQEATSFMDNNPPVTVLGLKHLDSKGNVAFSCSRFPKLKNHLNEIFGLSKLSPKIFNGASLMHDFDHLSSRCVDQVMGACMFIRRSIIDAIGFMDDRFFVFGEDMDFCKRVWHNGGKVYYNADISIIHECR